MHYVWKIRVDLPLGRLNRQERVVTIKKKKTVLLGLSFDIDIAPERYSGGGYVCL